MAKLSELFGRKAGDASAKTTAPPTSARNGHGEPDPVDAESVSDIGSHIGEENEALRNLLSDASRKIGELDDLKLAFDKLVTPFNSTLSALEQEKSQTLRLSGMLEEQRVAHQTLLAEFYQAEKKATALEAETGKQREDLELSSEANRALESARLGLVNDVAVRDAKLAELEPRLAQETAQHQTVRDAHRALQEQFERAEKRIGEYERDLAAAREKLALLDDEKRSLQAAVDQSLSESARLSRRLTESENTLSATLPQLGKVEASYAEAYAERGRLGAALDEAKDQHQSDTSNLNMRIEALRAHGRRRAAALRDTAKPDRANRGSTRLRPQVDGGDHCPQQRRDAAGPDRSLARRALAPDHGSRADARGADRAQ
jgi:crescentin